MKLLVHMLMIGLAAAGKAKETAPPACQDCDCADGQNDCLNLGCAWESVDGACHHPDPNPGEKGGYCNMKYTTTASGRVKYTKVGGTDGVDCLSDPECGAMTCFPIEDNGPEPDSGAIIGGTCECEMCHGKADPEQGFTDLDPTNEATIRVTICHRTCSTINPWVRITIDDDAWNGTAASGCGHQIHNVTHECWNQGNPDFIPWGKNRMDYLLKWHGTREYLRQTMGWDTPVCNNGGNCVYDSREKAYWFYWERACPYVRHGHCCDGGEKGDCCGDNPQWTNAPEVVPVTDPPETPCPVIMGQKGDEICTGLTDFHAVEMVKVQTGDVNLPIADPRDLIYNIEYLADGTVNFKVDNPFDHPIDMYVQHNALAPGQLSGAFDSNCEKMINEPGCNPDAPTINAACIDPGAENGMPFTIVSLYFVGTDESIFGTSGSGAIVEECCIDPAVNPLEATDKVIELTFEIHCACPPQVA